MSSHMLGREPSGQLRLCNLPTVFKVAPNLGFMTFKEASWDEGFFIIGGIETTVHL